MKIVIVGPTGVGKTKLSIELAKYYQAEVINADAVQIYKGLDIGSAKVTEEEKSGITHHLLDIKMPNEGYSSKDYQDDLRKIIDANPNKNYIIVGGTGLYICAGLMDYRFSLDEEPMDFSSYSKEELYKLAIEKDNACEIHPHNRVRLERFLNKKNTEVVEAKLLYDDCIFIGLTTARDNLYKKINDRVDKLFEQGLVDEVKALYEKYPDSKIINRAIGYKEVILYLKGNISLEEAKELIKKNSRHYAKRQYTWFNNKMNINWIEVNYSDFNKTINEAKELIRVAISK